MKTAITLLCLELFVTFSTSAQTVTFTKTYYVVNEPVKASVFGGLTGIENDITRTSSIASDGTVNVGTPTAAGVYNIAFNFRNQKRKSFLLIILPAGSSSTETLVIDLDYSANSKDLNRNIFIQMLKYFKEQSMDNLKIPVSKALKKFATENAVTVVHNVAFCIATGVSGQPLVAAVCKGLSQDNLEDLSEKMFGEFFADMEARNYLTPAQYKQINDDLGAYTGLGNILESNCSAVFQLVTQKMDNDDLKIAIGYQEQLCKSTVIMVKFYKKLP